MEARDLYNGPVASYCPQKREVKYALHSHIIKTASCHGEYLHNSTLTLVSTDPGLQARCFF